MWRKLTVWAGLGVIGVALAACGSSRSGTPATHSTRPPTTTTALANPTQALAAKQKGAMGSTVTHMVSAFGRREISGGACSAGPVCFGALVKNEEDDGYQFTSVLAGDGIVSGYSQNFPTGTSLATAQSQVLQYMPSDATASALVVDHNGGTCGMYNITSPTLGTIFSDPKIGDPSGVMGVELSYTDSNLNITYDPSNIENASISLGPSNPSSAC